MDQKKLNALLEGMFPMEESTKYFKALIYGDPGGGKTVLGGAIGDRVLHIEADPEGWQSLFNHPDLVVPGRMKRMKYLGVSQLEAIADAFSEGLPEFKQFDTLLIDTGSNIAALDLDVVTKEDIKKKGADNFDFDDHMWANYKKNAFRVRMAFLKLFLSPVNIVMTAHVSEYEHKKTGIVKTIPNFSPKILASINGMVSMIAYMTANEAGVDDDGSVKYQRRIQVHPTRSIIAKTRIGGLPPVIELEDEFHLRKIVDGWQATGGKQLSHEQAEKEIPEELGLNKPSPEISEQEDKEIHNTGLEL